MLKELIIKDFRNIRDASYPLSKINVLSGSNGLGKSNTLNAIVWLLSSVLYTDGTDLKQVGDSIIPAGSSRVNPEVTIVLDGGAEFTKRYVTTYAKGTDTVTGHKNEYLINNTKVNEKEFYEALYKTLDYKPVFDLSAKDGNEVNIFIDPLYALGKVDYKVLRTILSKLGCDVDFNEIPSYLKIKELVENKYLGNIANAIKDTKSIVQKANEELELVNNQITLYANAEEITEEEFNQLNEKKSELLLKIEKLKEQPNDTLIKQQKDEIQECEQKIRELKHKRSELIEDARKQFEKELTDNVTIKAGYIRAIDTSKNKISKAKISGNELFQASKKYEQELKEEMQRTFDATTIVCPHCGEEIILNESEREAWNKNHNDLLDSYKQKIKNAKDQCHYLANVINEETINIKAYEVLLAESEEKIEDIRKKITEASIQVDTKKIDASIRELEEQIKKDNSKIEELKLIDNYDALSERNSLQNELKAVEAEFDTYYFKKHRISQLNELKQKQELATKNWLEKQLILKNLNAFNKEYIKELNTRASNKTGIDFVLAEEYLDSKSDGFKEVCYATYNGIPYQDLNTSRKILLGIQFINIVKEIVKKEYGVNGNQLPLLIDKLEVLDSMEKLTDITQSQLICTRVSNEKEITLKGE